MAVAGAPGRSDKKGFSRTRPWLRLVLISWPPWAVSGLVVVILFAIWEGLQAIPVFSLTFIPRPSSIARHFVILLFDGTLVSHAFYTIIRVLGGFLAGALIGVPLGISMGRSKIAEDIAGPPINLLRPIAPIAWIPIAILFFGLKWQGPVFIVFIGSFFPIVIASAAAVRDIDPVVLNSVRTLGASSRQLFWEVILPGALPTTLMGGRIAVGISWTAVVAAELFGARFGLGFIINSASMNFRILDVFVGMAAIGVLGYLSDLTYLRFVRWKLAWMPTLEELRT